MFFRKRKNKTPEFDMGDEGLNKVTKWGVILILALFVYKKIYSEPETKTNNNKCRQIVNIEVEFIGSIEGKQTIQLYPNKEQTASDGDNSVRLKLLDEECK